MRATRMFHGDRNHCCSVTCGIVPRRDRPLPNSTRANRRRIRLPRSQRRVGGPRPLEVARLVGVRVRGRLLGLLACLVQHAGDGLGAGRQRRAAEQQGADPLAAPVGVVLLEHEDGAPRDVGQAAALGPPLGLSARPAGPSASTASRRTRCAWTGRRGARSRRPAALTFARCPAAAGAARRSAAGPARPPCGRSACRGAVVAGGALPTEAVVRLPPEQPRRRPDSARNRAARPR